MPMTDQQLKHPTIEEDLARAKEILAKGKANHFAGTIYQDDLHTAYKLLESFVAQIERLRERVKWFEASGGVTAHTRVFQEMARADAAEAEVERLTADRDECFKQDRLKTREINLLVPEVKAATAEIERLHAENARLQQQIDLRDDEEREEPW
jgi:hypothetical protein